MSKILLVSEYADKEISIDPILENKQYEIIKANSYNEGLLLLQNDTTIDLIICDGLVRKKKDFNFLRYLQKNHEYCFVPVIVTSYHCSASLVKELVGLGVKYIIQDISGDEALINRIDEIIEGGRRNILIVDDEELIQSMLKFSLELNRFKVNTASDGEEALRKLQSDKFHAVVTDIMMPKMNGVELLMEVKNIYKDIPVLLITGHSGKYNSKLLMESGADGFFKKPFNNMDLVATLNRVLLTPPKQKIST